VHVAIVRHSGRIVSASQLLLDSVKQKDPESTEKALRELQECYSTLNKTLDTMWERSKSERYLAIRTFIMGSKNQPMFPDGVMYAGVSPKPMFFRGESGANDSLVPLADNILEITARLPNNPLTMVLKDFREYRPRNHKAFLAWAQEKAIRVGVRNYIQNLTKTGHADVAVRYLEVVDEIRGFRHRHWLLTKDYILKRTRHPVATGGSPIVTWLPNQLDAVLSVLTETATMVDSSMLPNAREVATLDRILKNAQTERRVLDREVEKLRQKFAMEAGGERAYEGNMALS